MTLLLLFISTIFRLFTLIANSALPFELFDEQINGRVIFYVGVEHACCIPGILSRRLSN